MKAKLLRALIKAIDARTERLLARRSDLLAELRQVEIDELATQIKSA